MTLAFPDFQTSNRRQPKQIHLPPPTKIKQEPNCQHQASQEELANRINRSTIIICHQKKCSSFAIGPDTSLTHPETLHGSRVPARGILLQQCTKQKCSFFHGLEMPFPQLGAPDSPASEGIPSPQAVPTGNCELHQCEINQKDQIISQRQKIKSSLEQQST